MSAKAGSGAGAGCRMHWKTDTNTCNSGGGLQARYEGRPQHGWKCGADCQSPAADPPHLPPNPAAPTANPPPLRPTPRPSCQPPAPHADSLPLPLTLQINAHLCRQRCALAGGAPQLLGQRRRAPTGGHPDAAGARPPAPRPRPAKAAVPSQARPRLASLHRTPAGGGALWPTPPRPSRRHATPRPATFQHPGGRRQVAG